jgi:CRP-like cAMP-binding protein
MRANGAATGHLATGAQAPTRDQVKAETSAVFLSEYLTNLNEGAGFLSRLGQDERECLIEVGRPRFLERGEGLFFQGDLHEGVWVVQSGRLRTFYAGASGREMTLAYWTPGHFVGGPEVFGGGRHVWSADAADDSELLFLPGAGLRSLTIERPQIALAIIGGLVAKGKCYSALVQMLGTRSISDRLQILLCALASTHGRRMTDGGRIIDRDITQEQLAMMVGATRQWVSVSLKRLQADGLLSMSRSRITLRQAFFDKVEHG